MRVFPGSLKGQLILLTLVATLLSQAAGLLFILDDQRSQDQQCMASQRPRTHRNRERGDRSDASPSFMRKF